MRNDLYFSEKLSGGDIFQLNTAINVKVIEINEEIHKLKSHIDCKERLKEQENLKEEVKELHKVFIEQR